MYSSLILFNFVYLIQLSTSSYYDAYMNRINQINRNMMQFHQNQNVMQFHKNRTRPSKAFGHFFSNQNSILKSDKVQCGTRTVNFNPRRLAKIVGGTESPYGAFPWQVEIQILDPDRLTFGHHCGGAVIGDRLVVSAAHCFDRQPLQLEQIRVVTGEHRLKVQDSHETRFQVEKVYMHPDFRRNGPHSNDIALVAVRGRGTKGIQFNTHVRPICLPDQSSDTVGQWCSVSGWGLEDESTESFAPVLRAAEVPLLDLATCRKNQVLGGRQQQILDSMICAGSLGGGVDACRGDSGGPLACSSSDRFQLLGVVSWGAGCARKARPGVYTRVASYVTWIRSTAKTAGYSLP